MQVLNTTQLLDGSAVMEIHLTNEELVIMAKIGILEVLIEASRSYDVVDAEVVNGQMGD
jgi:hypothetical protein